jgi:glucose-6-phosphate 1-dehydrogenase
VLTIIAMEKPVSTEADDIRDEKVKVMKSIKPIKLEECVFGQYTANPIEGNADSQMGYLDDPTVPKVCAYLVLGLANPFLEVDRQMPRACWLWPKCSQDRCSYLVCWP